MQATDEIHIGTASKSLDWRDLNYSLKNGLLSRVRKKNTPKEMKRLEQKNLRRHILSEWGQEYTRSNSIFKNLTCGNTEMRAYHFQCFLQNPLYSGKLSSSLSSFTARFVTLDMLSKLKKSLL